MGQKNYEAAGNYHRDFFCWAVMVAVWARLSVHRLHGVLVVAAGWLAGISLHWLLGVKQHISHKELLVLWLYGDKFIFWNWIVFIEQKIPQYNTTKNMQLIKVGADPI